MSLDDSVTLPLPSVQSKVRSWCTLITEGLTFSLMGTTLSQLRTFPGGGRRGAPASPSSTTAPGAPAASKTWHGAPFGLRRGEALSLQRGRHRPRRRDDHCAAPTSAVIAWRHGCDDPQPAAAPPVPTRPRGRTATPNRSRLRVGGPWRCPPRSPQSWSPTATHRQSSPPQHPTGPPGGTGPGQDR